MLNGRHFLHVPGPTNIPERIIRAMTRTMEDQRGANFPKFTKPLYEDMKKILKKENTTLGVANGVLFADNKLIYEAENLKVGLFTT